MADDEPKDLTEEIGHWLKELEACTRREREYRKTGERILEIYDATKPEEIPFNILYSNTETLMPALYSTTPRPMVARRFKDDDPLGKAAADAGKRVLEFLIDTNMAGYETFDDGMTKATATALLPGRAWTSVKYDAKEEGDTYSGETVCVETPAWNRVYHGYARLWHQVPWVAYELYIDKDEATRLFGEAMAARLTFTEQETKAGSDETKGEKEEPDQGERKVTPVYQIWDKDGGRVVRYVSPQLKDAYCKVEEDPLELTGFFNCPPPLMFLQKPHTLLPTALYNFYESQANELNTMTRRIKKIIKAIKARGFYDGEWGEDIKKLMEADDDELVPTDRGASLAADKGFDKAVFFWPVDKLITVLRELYTAREACKQVIYEITGISDILRGASKASETLGAQEIKTQWGTLRLKRSQQAVARHAKELLRLMLEIAASKFSEETWAQMTGLPFLLSTQFNELTALAKTLELELMRRPAVSPPQPGLPAPPPDPLIQQLEQVKAQLQAPKWADVLALLKNDLHRAYRIDIETNSTVEPEAAEDQQMIQEVLTTVSQVLNGIGPLVAKGVLPFEAAQILLLTIVRRFRFGSELEDTIKAMKPPQPEDNGAEAAQKQLEMEKQQAMVEVQFKQKQAEMAVQEKSMQAELATKQREMDLQIREAQLKIEQELFRLEQQAAQQQAKLQEEAQLHRIALSEQSANHKLDLKRRDVQWQQQHKKEPVGAGR